eukprot:CAMPEP_0117036110 /NCGR_PEP_ID=MMETSP0472-20121206/25604_1 /TAXON_ID=693140 ORGANISM="Tiarina fusus, Strain LIS" /NCGR_SAMPLE_ID=MMETSP0472 /ASSEMBLY_ACC=CAM_ASM_000603 /LENGTH=571 /DNA_ID=CAMNT_0004745779 /DNA_START=161 /DNA_END=1873 /DNA_ORIENTATION=+
MIFRFQSPPFYDSKTRMLFVFLPCGTLLSLVSGVVALRGISGGFHNNNNNNNKENEEQRELYEKDDDNKSCLEDDFCRATVGLMLICFAPIVICWNEKAHVRLEQLYEAGQRIIRELDNPFHVNVVGDDGRDKDDGDDSNTIDHQFVCMNGTLEGGTTLKDPLFPSSIRVDDALLLKREIEIFQYVQVGNSDDGYKLKERWCKLPQPDPDKFPEKKNPIGNWNLFGGDKMLDTGHTLRGEPIRFKENVFVTRAPNPTLGAFAVPPALMDEGFLGIRNVYRLHEYQRIQESQGEWVNLFGPTARPPVKKKPGRHLVIETESPLAPPHVACRYQEQSEDGYFFDGKPCTIGTIRIKWQFAPAKQEVTIAAEAVSPDRASSAPLGYDGSGGAMMLHDLSDSNPKKLQHMKDMIMSEVCQGGEEPTRDELQPLFWAGEGYQCYFKKAAENKKFRSGSAPERGGSGTEEEGSNTKWTLTPCEVFEPNCLPPYGNKFLGQLWLFAPGRLSSNQLFRKARNANDKCLWMVRALTYSMLLLGWMLLFGPLTRMFGPGIFRSSLMLAFGVVAAMLATSCW